MRVERGARDLLWKAETETRGKRERMNEWVGREDRRWNDKQTDREPELACASPRAPLISENFPAPLVGITLNK